MNWQRRHEELLDELNEVAGKRVYDFYRDTAHLTGAKLARAVELNRLNDIAVANYYRKG
jgi:hypothetical protein